MAARILQIAVQPSLICGVNYYMLLFKIRPLMTLLRNIKYPYDDDTPSDEFIQLDSAMKRLFSFYQKEFNDTVEFHQRRVPEERRSMFRITIINIIHRWNCYIFHASPHIRTYLPQLMLSPHCECCAYEIPKDDVHWDPTFNVMKGITFFMDEKEILERINRYRKSNPFTDEERSKFIENLTNMTSQSHVTACWADFEIMWKNPFMRMLFVRQFNYYLDLKHKI
jgi:hypothetical protein